MKNNDIEIIRGTTYIRSLVITDADTDEEYILADDEKLIFGVKMNAESTEYNIQKTLTSADRTDSGYLIELSPEDTQDLPFGHYHYDVGLQCADGNYYMIIECSKFNIHRAITAKEATA